MKKYKLLKDLPGSKAGIIFIKEGFDESINKTYAKNHYKPIGSIASPVFFECDVENNPEWFEEVVESNFTKPQRDEIIKLIKEIISEK
jgi:hypothetical protein